MTIISEHASSTLQILFTTLDQDGVAKNISGATITAAARDYAGSTVDGVTAIVSPAAGTFTVDFAAGDLAAGVWEVQPRVVIGGESQVVAARMVEIVRAHV